MRAAWEICIKDLRIELRTKYTITLMFLFAFIALLMFSFSTIPFSPTIEDMAPGILWFVFIFSGMLGISRAFVREAELGTLDGLRLAPVSAEAILLGKVAYNLILMFALEAVALPLFIVFLNYTVKGSVLALIIILAAGNLGFVVVASAISVLIIKARARELLLPVILLPLLFPVILNTILALREVMIYGGGLINTVGNVKIILAYTAVMAAISMLTFELAISE